MIQIDIPGRESLAVRHVVLDYNGTLAQDGMLIEGVEERLLKLKEQVEVHVLTADTYGTVRQQCEPLGVSVETFPRAGAGACKLEIVQDLGQGVVCIGNGFNDVPMFDAAMLSIGVLEREGSFAGIVAHVDVLTRGIVDALDLLLKPDRLRATLRS